MILFITSLCNARCSHCFNWKNLNQKNDLSIEEIRALSGQLGPIDSLLLSGGEPFLRTDLAEICTLFFENNKIRSISIPTNGLDPLTIKTATKDILIASQGRNVFVNVSLDGTEKIHDKIRQVPGAFKKAIESYLYLEELKKEYCNLNIGIAGTIYNENYDDLFNLIDELKILAPDLQNFNLAFLRGLPKDRTYQLPSTQDLEKIYNYARKHFPKNHSLVNRTIDEIIFELKIKTLRKKTQILTCKAGKLMGVVDANGDVRLCELLEPIGNLREASFEEIWQSREAEAGRKKIANHECWCTHECFLFPSLLAHPAYYPVLLFRFAKNWLCAKT